ncbi:MAG: L,D-transpeptidase family protein [Yoonia sp.]
MKISRRLMVVGAAVGLAGCAAPRDPKFKTYSGPAVDRIQVLKGKRVMQLWHKKTLLKSYDVELGFDPVGHKQIEGDGRTPEGAYRINRTNPNSRYHLSLGISYPNRNDYAKARAMGKSPGGEIFIHGTPKNYIGESDWTWGCIAVTDAEMEEIYAMVDVGTAIYLYP